MIEIRTPHRHICAHSSSESKDALGIETCKVPSSADVWTGCIEIFIREEGMAVGVEDKFKQYFERFNYDAIAMAVVCRFINI